MLDHIKELDDIKALGAKRPDLYGRLLEQADKISEVSEVLRIALQKALVGQYGPLEGWLAIRASEPSMLSGEVLRVTLSDLGQHLPDEDEGSELCQFAEFLAGRVKGDLSPKEFDELCNVALVFLMVSCDLSTGETIEHSLAGRNVEFYESFSIHVQRWIRPLVLKSCGLQEGTS